MARRFTARGDAVEFPHADHRPKEGRYRTPPKKRVPKASPPVTAKELADDIILFIAGRYEGRTLDIETARIGLSNAAHDLTLIHLREVAQAKRRSLT